MKVIAIAAAITMFVHQAHAQEKPDCTDIQPAIGQVCYLEFPLTSQHLRDCTKFDGCRESFGDTWEMPSGHALLNFEMHRTGGFGATGAGCNMSGNMEGSVSTQQIESAVEKLREMKGKLEGELIGCAGAACGELSGGVDAVSRTIETLRTVEDTVFQYGNNGGLNCRGSLRVRFAGPGARWDGFVRANVRYVGTPGSLDDLVLQHEEAVNQALAAAN